MDDEGRYWSKSETAGISGEITAIAAHPEQPSTVVVGTVRGAYVSKDSGSSFEKLLTDKQVTGLSFSPNGKLYTGTYLSGKSGLVKVEPGFKGIRNTSNSTKDAVAFIAINPLDEKEVSMVTFDNKVYRSNDGGENWSQIAGQVKSL